ncbi:hypothetical protein PC110_g6227 [Phytophthora cactorum]|uniref:Uncharacterized protein n=1 Tax=Phytophthora cactorum TaxID=29920 RepID=A0A329SLR0_9STRA|nr:hypothetical protein PC110_g6227 [Phytophthora cactorum]
MVVRRETCSEHDAFIARLKGKPTAERQRLASEHRAYLNGVADVDVDFGPDAASAVAAPAVPRPPRGKDASYLAAKKKAALGKKMTKRRMDEALKPKTTSPHVAEGDDDASASAAASLSTDMVAEFDRIVLLSFDSALEPEPVRSTRPLIMDADYTETPGPVFRLTQFQSPRLWAVARWILTLKMIWTQTTGTERRTKPPSQSMTMRKKTLSQSQHQYRAVRERQVI